MSWGYFWDLLKQALILTAEQIPGVIVALIVAEAYFRRQRRIDEMKEKKEVELAHKKLMNAYITSGGFRPKVGNFKVHEAMAELRMKLEIYRPKFDADKWLRDAANDAVKFVADHREEFEKISDK